MYRVLAVDDEPAARNHIKNIVTKKCGGFEVGSMAQDGEEALDIMKSAPVDVVITDVKMPGMDGITLAGKIKELYPETLVVIISGYQEFEYAKGALVNGAMDYLLKPVRPQALASLMETLKARLDKKACEIRNKILRKICNEGIMPQREKMERYFQKGIYFLALLRVNALPHVKGEEERVELFTMEGEQLYVYGKDEREMLIVCPKEMFSVKELRDSVVQLAGRQSAGGFYTVVYSREEACPMEFAEKIKRLYQAMERNVRLGKNQVLVLEDTKSTGDGQNYFSRIEHMAKKAGQGSLGSELQALFRQWDGENRTQLWVEAQVRYLLFQYQKYGLLRGSLEECTLMVEDAFNSALSMDELCGSLIIVLNGSEDGTIEGTEDKEALFHRIKAYIGSHLQENVSVAALCREFGVSQTTLGKLFRRYGECSFNSYLTQMRIKEAKRIMEEEPECFIWEVAERVGYKDQFYFSRIFRSVTGVCPSEFLGRREDEK